MLTKDQAVHLMACNFELNPFFVAQEGACQVDPIPTGSWQISFTANTGTEYVLKDAFGDLTAYTVEVTTNTRTWRPHRVRLDTILRLARMQVYPFANRLKTEERVPNLYHLRETFQARLIQRVRALDRTAIMFERVHIRQLEMAILFTAVQMVPDSRPQMLVADCANLTPEPSVSFDEVNHAVQLMPTQVDKLMLSTGAPLEECYLTFAEILADELFETMRQTAGIKEGNDG